MAAGGSDAESGEYAADLGDSQADSGFAGHDEGPEEEDEEEERGRPRKRRCEVEKPVIMTDLEWLIGERLSSLTPV